MRHTPKLLLAVTTMLPFVAAADPPSTFRMQANGFGVVSVIQAEGADGSFTVGYLFGINLVHGERPDVPYSQALVFFGERYEPSLGFSVPFIGAGEATYEQGGMHGATVSGTFEANPFYDGSNLPPEPLPPITIDVDLTFTGTGSVYQSTAHFAAGAPGSAYVFYDAARWRYADATGTVTVNGDAASVDYEQLLAETAGEFNLVAMP
jgi:hypothetical protein